MKSLHTYSWHSLIRALIFVVGLTAMLGIMPETAFAQTVPNGTCTTDPQFDIPTPPPGTPGFLSTIVVNIQLILETVSQSMFEWIVADIGFVQLVRIVCVLYIAIYGLLFTFGMVQITLYDFVIRMVKIGIIATLISPGAWNFFRLHVVEFFNNGTDALINVVTAIGAGGIGYQLNLDPAYCAGMPKPADCYPFGVLDTVIAKAVSAKMAVTLAAVFTTGPYGALFGLLLLMSLGSFLKALVNALWVYLMSLVLKTLLFGLAPIFLVCLLFNRTQHIFQGWLNQIVNASLQPILLFAFFAFFAKLIEACIDNVMTVPVCWTEWSEPLRGSPFSTHYWRFALFDAGGNPQMYNGIWDFTGAPGAPAGSPIFPIDIMVVLTFLILAELAGRFNSIVIEIAKGLAGAATNLAEMRGAVSDFSRMAGGKTSGGATTEEALKQARAGASAVGTRPATGGSTGGTTEGGTGGTTTVSGGGGSPVNPYAPGAGTRST